MDSEIIVELAASLLEAGASTVTDKKSGCGCLIFILVFVLIIGTMYFTEKETTNSPEIKKQNIIKQ